MNVPPKLVFTKKLEILLNKLQDIKSAAVDAAPKVEVEGKSSNQIEAYVDVTNEKLT